MRLDAQGRLQRYEEAFADYDAPFAFDISTRCGAMPINCLRAPAAGWRRSRCVADHCNAKSLMPVSRFDGATFTLTETLWLAGQNLLLAYPPTDRALRALGELTAKDPGRIVMVDSVEHLIERTTDKPVRLCLDFDAPMARRRADKNWFQALAAAHPGAGLARSRWRSRGGRR